MVIAEALGDDSAFESQVPGVYAATFWRRRQSATRALSRRGAGFSAHDPRERRALLLGAGCGQRRAQAVTCVDDVDDGVRRRDLDELGEARAALCRLHDVEDASPCRDPLEPGWGAPGRERVRSWRVVT